MIQPQIYVSIPNAQLLGYSMNLDSLLSQCTEEINNQLNFRPPIKVFGKQCFQHRNVGFFSDISHGYSYSNSVAESKPLTPSLKTLMEIINSHFEADYNGILINEYTTGEDYIAAHSDAEKELSRVGVVCVSYGASRKFRVRDKVTKRIICDIPTSNHEVLIMTGDFQKHFLHEIPPEKKIKESRISFTFRKHLV